MIPKTRDGKWVLALRVIVLSFIIFLLPISDRPTPKAIAADEEAASSESQDQSSPTEEPTAQDVSSDAPLTPLSEQQTPADQSIQAGSAGLDEKVSLDLRNIDVTDALRFLAQKAGLNLVISKSVTGRVQLLLNNVPVRDVMDLIMITGQLAYEKRGDIYYIMTEAEFKERFGRKFSDTRQVKVFRLKYAVPDQAFSLFEILKSEIGRLLVDPETGTVLVMDTQENIDRMQRALEGLEQKRQIKVFDLKYAKALDVEARLKTQLDAKKVGLVSSDERTNQVIVETISGRMEDVEALIADLDQKTREVSIDAKIVKVTLSDDFNAEIQWEGLASRVAKYGTQYFSNHPFAPVVRTNRTQVDNFTNIQPTANPAAGVKSTLTENLFLGFIDNDDAFELLINFLKTIGKTKILSNPKITVTNNQEAKIHVGEKQAYVTTTTTTGQNTTTTAESVTFIDIGIQLAVTPTINADDYVTMKVKPEISSVSTFLITPSGNKIPIIDSSTAETNVMVKNGTSIVIGGLRKDEKTETRKKIPLLGDIPILGKPFNSFNTTNERSELLIVITPNIVQGDTLVSEGRPVGEKPFLPYTDYSDYNSPMKVRK